MLGGFFVFYSPLQSYGILTNAIMRCPLFPPTTTSFTSYQPKRIDANALIPLQKKRPGFPSLFSIRVIPQTEFPMLAWTTYSILPYWSHCLLE